MRRGWRRVGGRGAVDGERERRIKVGERGWDEMEGAPNHIQVVVEVDESSRGDAIVNVNRGLFRSRRLV